MELEVGHSPTERLSVSRLGMASSTQVVSHSNATRRRFRTFRWSFAFDRSLDQSLLTTQQMQMSFEIHEITRIEHVSPRSSRFPNCLVNYIKKNPRRVIKLKSTSFANNIDRIRAGATSFQPFTRGVRYGMACAMAYSTISSMACVPLYPLVRYDFIEHLRVAVTVSPPL